jgi:hypothetical protein
MLGLVDAAGTWIAVAVGLAALGVGILAYRNRQPRTRLEYVVTTRSEVLPAGLPETFRLVHQGDLPVEDPAMVILRIVNTGDRAIPDEDFASDLTITLRDAEVVSAICTAERPADLKPQLVIGGDAVHLKPLLLNSGDMIQLQMLSAGLPSRIEIGGRVKDLSIARRTDLPYPPGSGPNGEFAGVMDYFIWFLFLPGFILFVGGAIATNGHNSTAGRFIGGAAALILALVIYPLQVSFLLRRRRLWATEGR